MSLEIAVLVVLAGVLVGMLSAMFGVGGGLLMVPFMVLALGAGLHLAEGTSLLVIVPTAVAGVLAHLRRGYVSLGRAAYLSLGGLAGVYIGAGTALRLEGGNLRFAFGLFLALMGAHTVAAALRRRGRDRVRD